MIDCNASRVIYDLKASGFDFGDVCWGGLMFVASLVGTYTAWKSEAGPKVRVQRWVAPLAGIASLAWMSVSVIPAWLHFRQASVEYSQGLANSIEGTLEAVRVSYRRSAASFESFTVGRSVISALAFERRLHQVPPFDPAPFVGRRVRLRLLDDVIVHFEVCDEVAQRR